MNNKTPKRHQELISHLEDHGLLYPGEGYVIAMTHRVKNKPNWGAVVGICATRAAHKKGMID